MAVQYPWHTMKIFNKNKGLEGIGIAQERGVRFRYMIQEEAKRRAKIFGGRKAIFLQRAWRTNSLGSLRMLVRREGSKDISS